MGYYDYKPSQSTNKSAYYLGTLAHGAVMNVAAKYAGYANLTANNFVVVPQSGDASATGYKSFYHEGWDANWTEEHHDTNTASYRQPEITYNPSSGQLSFSCTLGVGGSAYCNQYGGWWSGLQTNPSTAVGLTAKVYLLPDIENL